MQPSTPPGWYPDPFRQAALRWYDGYRWTPATQGQSEGQKHARVAANLGVSAVAIIGAVLACFTSVSLLTGTTTVWVGAGMAIVAAVAGFSLRWVDAWVRVVACLLAVAAIGSGIYDEVQLQHKRDQINQILGGSRDLHPSASLPADRLPAYGPAST